MVSKCQYFADQDFIIGFIPFHARRFVKLILSIISGSYYGFGPYDIMDFLSFSTEDRLGLVIARTLVVK